jgi:ketosteroid isomerase-like protein
MMEAEGMSRSSFLKRATAFIAGLFTAPLMAAETNSAAPAAVTPNVDPKLYLEEFKAFDNKTLEQKVQELGDREELRELISKYAHKIARGYSVADMFTEDGDFITRTPAGPPTEVRPRAAIAKMYEEAIPKRVDTPKPQIHNYVFAISGDNAKGVCSNELRITSQGQSIIASGYYDDIYRRENGRWSFVVRDANFFHWVPIQQGWAKSVKPI